METWSVKGPSHRRRLGFGCARSAGHAVPAASPSSPFRPPGAVGHRRVHPVRDAGTGPRPVRPRRDGLLREGGRRRGGRQPGTCVPRPGAGTQRRPARRGSCPAGARGRVRRVDRVPRDRRVRRRRRRVARAARRAGRCDSSARQRDPASSVDAPCPRRGSADRLCVADPHPGGVIPGVSPPHRARRDGVVRVRCPLGVGALDAGGDARVRVHAARACPRQVGRAPHGVQRAGATRASRPALFRRRLRRVLRRARHRGAGVRGRAREPRGGRCAARRAERRCAARNGRVRDAQPASLGGAALSRQRRARPPVGWRSCFSACRSPT